MNSTKEDTREVSFEIAKVLLIATSIPTILLLLPVLLVFYPLSRLFLGVFDRTKLEIDLVPVIAKSMFMIVIVVGFCLKILMFIPKIILTKG